MRRTLAVALASLLSLVACSAELAPDGAEPAFGEGLEGLSADDAEAAAARLLAEANAKRIDFEPAENRTRADSSAGAPSAQGARVAPRGLVEDSRAALGQGTWGFRFVVLKRGGGGERKVLSEDNTSAKLLGASTFKLFTGWTAFKTGSTRASTLTLMLRASQNALANLAMCQNGEKLKGYDAPCASRTKATTSMRFKDAIPASLAYLRGEGVALSASYTQVDGSGLDVKNLLTVDDLTSVLDDINSDPRRGEFLPMLAQPGVSSTLQERFPGLEGKLFAKTGTYFDDGGGVKALAGFVELDAERTLEVAVVGNGVGDPKKALDRIEAVVRTHIEAASPSR